MNIQCCVAILFVIIISHTRVVEDDIQALETSARGGGIGSISSLLKLKERCVAGKYSLQNLEKDIVVGARHAKRPLKTVYPLVHWATILGYGHSKAVKPSGHLYTLARQVAVGRNGTHRLSESEKSLIRRCLNSQNPNDWPLAAKILFGEDPARTADLLWFMQTIKLCSNYANDTSGRLKSLGKFCWTVLR